MQIVATLLGALQFTLLGILLGAEAVTPYALMSQATMALQVPLVVLQQPLWTRFTALRDAGQRGAIRRMFGQYLVVATAYSVVAGAALIWLTNPVLAFLLGPAITISIELRVGFAILCGLGLVAGGNLGALLLSLNLSRANAWLSVAQLVVFLAAAFALVPRVGSIGMLASVILTYVVAVPVFLHTVPRHLREAGSAPAGARVASAAA
jgi:O-antigen/teichoic acid export membrane protein